MGPRRREINVISQALHAMMVSEAVNSQMNEINITRYFVGCVISLFQSQIMLKFVAVVVKTEF